MHIILAKFILAVTCVSLFMWWLFSIPYTLALTLTSIWILVDNVVDILLHSKEREESDRIISNLTASLMASVSLLKSNKNIKKAAPSNMMFDQMIKDYEKSIEEGRAYLLNNKNILKEKK